MHPDDIRTREGAYEVVAVFPAQYTGTCTLNSSHKIKRGTLAGRVRLIENPLLPVSGVACAGCLKLLPRSEDR